MEEDRVYYLLDFSPARGRPQMMVASLDIIKLMKFKKDHNLPYVEGVFDGKLEDIWKDKTYKGSVMII